MVSPEGKNIHGLQCKSGVGWEWDGRVKICHHAFTDSRSNMRHVNGGEGKTVFEQKSKKLKPIMTVVK